MLRERGGTAGSESGIRLRLEGNMFRTGQNVPAADIDQYLPELRAYIKVHTQPEEKPEAGHPFLENVRYSRAPVFYEDNTGGLVAGAGNVQRPG